jgi:GntR family transcriptional regulator
LLIVISYSNPEPIFRQIISQIKTAITTGDLNAGEKLPSIREMAGELKVSVITVKRAYSELEAEGLITTRAGLGSFVAEVDQEQIRKKLRQEFSATLSEMIATAVAHEISGKELQQLLEELLKKENQEKGK